MNKIYISANELLEDAFTLAQKIVASGYRPDLIVGVWRGGAPIAVAVHEYFDYLGFDCDHCCLRTRSYMGIQQQNDSVEVDNFEYLISRMHSEASVLIVDDVFDSGRSVETIRRVLKEHSGSAMAKISVASIWFKQNKNRTKTLPDFYLKTTDDWLVFPHELNGLKTHEIALKRCGALDSLTKDIN